MEFFLVIFHKLVPMENCGRDHRKNFFHPNVQNIRDLLMDQVDGNGVRIRTDINGSATIQNLDKSLY